jgi:hypothetical protein
VQSCVKGSGGIKNETRRIKKNHIIFLEKKFGKSIEKEKKIRRGIGKIKRARRFSKRDWTRISESMVYKNVCILLSKKK